MCVWWSRTSGKFLAVANAPGTKVKLTKRKHLARSASCEGPPKILGANFYEGETAVKANVGSFVTGQTCPTVQPWPLVPVSLLSFSPLAASHLGLFLVLPAVL